MSARRPLRSGRPAQDLNDLARRGRPRARSSRPGPSLWLEPVAERGATRRWRSGQNSPSNPELLLECLIDLLVEALAVDVRVLLTQLLLELLAALVDHLRHVLDRDTGFPRPAGEPASAQISRAGDGGLRKAH